MKHVVLAVATIMIGALVIAVGLALLSRRPSQTKKITFTIIHANGAPCPPGYVLAKDFFIEADGAREDACILKDARELSIDVLKLGEGVKLRVQLPSDKEKI